MSFLKGVDLTWKCPLVQIKRQKPEESMLTQELYKAFVRGTPMSGPANDVLHTVYHKRDKSLTAAVKDW